MRISAAPSEDTASRAMMDLLPELEELSLDSSATMDEVLEIASEVLIVGFGVQILQPIQLDGSRLLHQQVPVVLGVTQAHLDKVTLHLQVLLQLAPHRSPLVERPLHLHHVIPECDLAQPIRKQLDATIGYVVT